MPNNILGPSSDQRSVSSVCALCMPESYLETIFNAVNVSIVSVI